MLLFVLSLCGFAASMMSRLLDPVITDIAADFAVPVGSAALLSSAYTLPFAFSQPILGPAGDWLGKPIVIKVCIVALVFFAVTGALATSLPILFASRVLAGIAGAGILPIAMALIGDSVAMKVRQIAISRFLIASLGGQLAGASSAGFIAAAVSWRGVFWIAGAVAAVAAFGALMRLPREPSRPPQAGAPGGALGRYRLVLQNPLARICFSTVFVEGAVIYGWMPYLGHHLQIHGMGGSREAGLVIGSLAIGGVLYSLCVPLLVRRFDRRQMMAGGGCCAGIGLACLALAPQWGWQAASLGIAGFGFFLLHNPIQTEVSELAPAARASAFAMHSASLFIGQALGPVLYGAGIDRLGFTPSLCIGAACFCAAGLTASRLLRL